MSRLAARVDAVLLDAGLRPAAGPLAMLERIRAVAPGVRVVVVADALDEVLSVAARDGELDGVVLASAAGAELAAAMAQVVAGHAVFPAGWLRQVRQSAAPARSRSSARASARSSSCCRSGWTTTRSPRASTSRATR